MVREDLSTGNPLFKILGHYCGVNWHQLPTARGQQLLDRRHRGPELHRGTVEEQCAALFAASRQPA